MSNQSPAEALRQQIAKYMEYAYNHPSDSLDAIMELVTAYTATVEREARIDELQNSVKLFAYGAKHRKAFNDRLAALQGPQDDQ